MFRLMWRLSGFVLFAFLQALTRATNVDGFVAQGGGEVVDVVWSVPLARRLAGLDLEGLDGHDGLYVSFTADSVHFNLHLTLNRALLPSTVRHVLHYRGGHTTLGPMPPPCFYTGQVLGDAGGSVSVSACDGSAGLTGLVLAHGRALTLEPLEVDTVSVGGGRRHLARRVDDEQHLDFLGDVASFARGMSNSSVRRLTGSSTKHVETIVVNDHSRYNAFGGQAGLDNLATHTASVMSAVTAIYQAAPTNEAAFPYVIQVVLVAMHTFIDSDPWEDDVTMIGSETDVSSLLDLFNTWAQTQQAAGMLVPNDNRILLSSRDFEGRINGYAGVSAMCQASRSGSVNRCGLGQADRCASLVAHEMGHNFGMRHDSRGNGCPKQGLIMEPHSSKRNPVPDRFSHCSVSYLTDYFESSYEDHGACLENMPSSVLGEPICGNGFVEVGEQCDCGATDCRFVDPCCDGSTCTFSHPGYECSDYAGPCCRMCHFVDANASFVCRPERNGCDVAEVCPGNTADCPQDSFVYPGESCIVEGFAGLCFAGECESMSATCASVSRDFDGTWDLTDTCAAFNDECETVVCHNSTNNQTADHDCGQNFIVHGKHMAVPEGTPCWFPGDPVGQRAGMCQSGSCVLPHTLAVVPHCGNGGIDFGEQCDCGSLGGDPCCDCTTCQLHPGYECSSTEPCCNNCLLASIGTVCRPAIGECDLPEVCSGASGVCPSDVGKLWGTPCTAADGQPSTCYGKVCLDSLDQQCEKQTGGERPYAHNLLNGKMHMAVPPEKPRGHLCTAPSCCLTRTTFTRPIIIDNITYSEPPWPVLSNHCVRTSFSKTFTVNGISNTIHLKALLDGTVLGEAGEMCLDATLVVPKTSCGTKEFFVDCVGRCLPCDSACSSCTGPSNFDCIGACVHGPADQRGACPISVEQASFASTIFDVDTPIAASTVAPTPAPTATPTVVPSATPTVDITTNPTGISTVSTIAPSQTTTALPAEVRGYIVVDGYPSGYGDTCGSYQSAVVESSCVEPGNAALAGTRCCHDNGTGSSICARPCATYNFADALAACEADGMRLCMPAEVLAGQVAGTGCNYDDLYVWTSEACGNPHVGIVADVHMGPALEVNVALVPSTTSGAASLTAESAKDPASKVSGSTRPKGAEEERSLVVPMVPWLHLVFFLLLL